MPRTLTQAAVADFHDRLRHIAEELFMERGHDGFTMRELAKRLGVSAMTPYRYFKDKDEIIAWVRARAFARLADRLETAHATPGSVAEKCAALSHAYVQFARQEPLYYRLVFDLSRPRIDSLPELELQKIRALTALIMPMHLLVEQGVLEGEPKLIGHVLLSALHGAVALNLAGQLCDSEFDHVLSETLRVLVNTYSRTVAAGYQQKSPAEERPSYPVPKRPMSPASAQSHLVLSAAE